MEEQSHGPTSGGSQTGPLRGNRLPTNWWVAAALFLVWWRMKGWRAVGSLIDDPIAAVTMEPFANLAIRPNIEVSAHGVTDLGVIELGAGEVQIDVRARAGSGKMHAAFAFPGFDVYTPGPRQPEQDGRLGLQHLAAGAYRVMVWGENVLPCFRDVIVAIDSVTAITIEQQPGVRTEVRLPGSIGVMNVHMPDGSVLREIVLNLKSWVRGLAPGSYRLEYVEFDGDRHTAEFTVGTQSGRPVNLSLRSR